MEASESSRNTFIKDPWARTRARHQSLRLTRHFLADDIRTYIFFFFFCVSFIGWISQILSKTSSEMCTTGRISCPILYYQCYSTAKSISLYSKPSMNSITSFSFLHLDYKWTMSLSFLSSCSSTWQEWCCSDFCLEPCIRILSRHTDCFIQFYIVKVFNSKRETTSLPFQLIFLSNTDKLNEAEKKKKRSDGPSNLSAVFKQENKQKHDTTTTALFPFVPVHNSSMCLPVPLLCSSSASRQKRMLCIERIQVFCHIKRSASA